MTDPREDLDRLWEIMRDLPDTVAGREKFEMLIRMHYGILVAGAAADSSWWERGRDEALDGVIAHLKAMPHDPPGRGAVYFNDGNDTYQHDDPAFALSEIIARIEELR